MPRWSSVLIALALASMVIVPLARDRPWERRVEPTAAPPPPAQIAVVVTPPPPWHREQHPEIDECLSVQMSVLIERDRLFAGLTLGDRVEIANVGGDHDWDGLESRLRRFTELPVFAARDWQWLEIAASDDVAFESVQQAIAVAHAAGFTEYRLGDPGQLSVRFRE